MGSLISFIFALSSTIGWAEYRVFHLRIEKKAPPAAPGEKAPEPEVRFVDSTLDPWQYKTYYPVAADESVTYTSTWRCYGRTDNRPLCPNPRQPATSAEGPESTTPSATP